MKILKTFLIILVVGVITYFTAFNLIKLQQENSVKSNLNEVEQAISSIPPSQERVALRALFHKNPEYINDTIIEGLKEGNREKVYNEIRNLGFPEIAELFGKSN